ncbi:MAG: SEC-C metal-binding domain-containing protein, partial [Pseudomonadota bacterium]
VKDWANEEGIADEEIRERLRKAADEAAARKVAQYGGDLWRQVEKSVLLQTLDQLWREHIATLDHLRSVVGFRGYGQRDPLNEYKTEAFALFEAMLSELRTAVTSQLMRIEIRQPDAAPSLPMDDDLDGYEPHHFDPFTGEDEFELADENLDGPPRGDAGDVAVQEPRVARKPAAARNAADPRTWGKVSRNEQCPCGSGRKFKHCHGKPS